MIKSATVSSPRIQMDRFRQFSPFDRKIWYRREVEVAVQDHQGEVEVATQALQWGSTKVNFHRVLALCYRVYRPSLPSMGSTYSLWSTCTIKSATVSSPRIRMDRFRQFSPFDRKI
jgi:hypothetical protein